MDRKTEIEIMSRLEALERMAVHTLSVVYRISGASLADVGKATEVAKGRVQSWRARGLSATEADYFAAEAQARIAQMFDQAVAALAAQEG